MTPAHSRDPKGDRTRSDRQPEDMTVGEPWRPPDRVDISFAHFLSPASFRPVEKITPSAWCEHAPFAFWLVEQLKPEMFVELGTHHGFSYFAFCQAIRMAGLSTAAFAVDRWTGDEHAGFYGEGVYQTV